MSLVPFALVFGRAADSFAGASVTIAAHSLGSVGVCVNGATN
jgi:hypothetical protein